MSKLNGLRPGTDVGTVRRLTSQAAELLVSLAGEVETLRASAQSADRTTSSAVRDRVQQLDHMPSYDGRPKKAVPASGVVKYSELSDYQNFPCLYHEGYLMKSRAPSRMLFKRRKSNNLLGNLHRRFFVLQGHFLTYFKSHQVKKPSKDLSVDMRLHSVKPLRNHEFGQFGVEVSAGPAGAGKSDEQPAGKVVFLLFASSQPVHKMWLQMLSRACTKDV